MAYVLDTTPAVPLIREKLRKREAQVAAGLCQHVDCPTSGKEWHACPYRERRDRGLGGTGVDHQKCNCCPAHQAACADPAQDDEAF